MNKEQLHVFFDFDSTVVTKESLDMTIELALDGREDREELVNKVEEITNEGMEGVLKFTDSLQKRFVVVPLNKKHFLEVGQILLNQITPGMEELFAELKENNIPTFIISGGFRDSILPVADKLEVSSENVFANSIICNEDGEVVGVDESNICYTDNGKAPVIKAIKEKFNLEGKFLMVGDGANDFKAYELGIADYFCGFTANVEREVIKKNAPVVCRSASEVKEFIFSLV